MGHVRNRMPDEDDHIFELAPEQPSPAPAPIPRMVARTADDPLPVQEIDPETASVLPPQPVPYQGPRGSQRAEDNAFPDRIIDFQMPLWLLIGGAAVEIGAAVVRAHGPAGLRPAMLALGLQLIVGSIIMLLGLLIAAKYRGIDLGRLGVALLKLAAIAVAPTAAVTLVSPFLNAIPFVGGIAGLGIQFILYFALLGALFKMDESDTWYCVCVIFLVNLAIYFALLATPWV